jgi:hypothetical protein
MRRPIAAEQVNDAGLASASECWVTAFGGPPLAAADASDLVASAQAITQAVARAARQLTWQTPDSFIAVLRRAEQSSDC